MQSLTTLNDPVFVEAAEALAIKMIDFESKNLEDKLSFGFELVLFKKPDLERLEVLKDFFEKALVEYQKDDNPNSELQAMTNLAGVILNLGEVLVRG